MEQKGMNTNMDNFETAGNGNSKKQKVFKEIVSWSLCLLGAFIIALCLQSMLL